MVEQDDSLTAILKAASDPTRRGLLTLLVQHGPTRVTDLATHFDMSLNAISKHIKVLERAGLVSRKTAWREHLIEANMEPIGEIDRWFRDLRSIWEMRLETLETELKKDDDMTDLSLSVSRRIDAPIGKVFDAWLDPKMLARFMCPVDGATVPAVETDPVEGGRYSIVMRTGETDIPHAGTYLEIKRTSRIVFTWESEFSAEGSTVTLSFAEAGGATDVTLTHVKFRSEESVENHRNGWTRILGELSDAMAPAHSG